MSDVLIRGWAPQDFQRIKEICKQTGLFTPFFGKSHYMWMVEKRRKGWLDPLWGFELLVAEIDGLVVGVTFAFKELVVGSVALLAVHPEYQGRGIGSRLLDEACERLRKKFVRLVFILIDPHAKADRRSELGKFYRRHGFKVLGVLCIKKL